jgi:hypothetical protein
MLRVNGLLIRSQRRINIKTDKSYPDTARRHPSQYRLHPSKVVVELVVSASKTKRECPDEPRFGHYGEKNEVRDGDDMYAGRVIGCDCLPVELPPSYVFPYLPTGVQIAHTHLSWTAVQSVQFINPISILHSCKDQHTR